MRAEQIWRYGSLGLSILLYILCLPSDAFCVRDVQGYQVLTAGPVGLLVSAKTSWAWLANPLLFGAWVALGVADKIRTVAFDFMGLVLATLTVAVFFLLQREVVTDGRGIAFAITGYGIGYWLWLSGMAACFLGNVATNRIFVGYKSVE